MSLTASQYLKTFLMRLVVIGMNVSFDTVKWKCLYNNEPVFSEWTVHKAIKSYVDKRSIKSARHIRSFNLSIWKTHWYNFRFHIATKLQKNHNFQILVRHARKISIIIWDGNHNILLFWLHICMRLDFLHRLQPRQHIAPDWIQKHVWEPSVF